MSRMRHPNSLGTFASSSSNISTFEQVVTGKPKCSSVRIWGIADGATGTAEVEAVRLGPSGTVVQAIRGTLTVLSSPSRRVNRDNAGGDYLTDHFVFDTGSARYSDHGEGSDADGGLWKVGVVAFGTITSIDLWYEVVSVDTA